jgi:predicted cation transporter
MVSGLILIFLLVLFLPLLLQVVERNLEVFLFLMGILAAALSGLMSRALFIKASQAPIKIALAVFVAGLLFKWLRKPLERGIIGLSEKMPFRLFIGLTVLFLGLISSIITAIIAALILVLIVQALRLERKFEVRFVVLSCFSIGLGAALTPIGEPLSTIAISKLGKGFFYLIELIGPEVISALLLFSLLAFLMIRRPTFRERSNLIGEEKETYEDILIRALKIYFFVMGLEFLGEGFEPLIDRFFLGLEPSVLYWLNMISAVLDNATLTATEVSRSMGPVTLKAILLGLLISGGMLIPGNIPNIISASKLKIRSGEWAKFGVPLGLIIMLIFYFSLFDLPL